MARPGAHSGRGRRRPHACPGRGHAAQRSAIAEPNSLLARLAGGSGVEAPQILEAAKRGDATALGVLDREAGYLGIGFTALIHLYSPERLVMGSGVAAAFDLMETRIRAVIRSRAMPAFRDVRVVPAGLNANSGLVGAAALALDATGHARPGL